MGKEPTSRRARGTAVIELVKTLRAYRREHPIEGLSAQAEALLEQRILPNDWYPLEPFQELLQFTYRQLLGSSEEAALQMGVRGGHVLLTGPHKAFIRPGDPAGSVVAMRHIWRPYYDFGELSGEMDGDSGVRFELSGYPDVTAPHGMMIAGWGVAAAQLGGAKAAGCEVLERPWKGGDRLIYRVHWSGGDSE